jgi:hypothetical protein
VGVSSVRNRLFGGALIVLMLWTTFIIWYAVHIDVVHKPTEDQLYGCTVEQEAPNGECK